MFDGELLGRPGRPQKTMLGEALNLLAGAALRFRECLTVTDPIWSLIAILARGRLLAARPIT